jgi:hypothetical protein
MFPLAHDCTSSCRYTDSYRNAEDKQVATNKYWR